MRNNWLDPTREARVQGCMVKRIRAQAITDDLAFPVRVKLAVPPYGLGAASQRIDAWLKSELGPGR